VFDFRDTTVVAYKKTRPITIRRRTIGGVIKGSLSETLGNEGVEAAASRIARIYSGPLTFKLKKGDRFAVTFTERFINDSVYNE
jgi:hypothetical protein